MNKAILTAVTLLIASSSYSQTATKNTTDNVAVQGTKVSMTPPAGFTVAENFNGFQQESSGSSIMVVEGPGPFSEISGAFTKEGLLKQGIDLKKQQDITVSDLPGKLLKTEQQAYGNTYSKYVLVFGTEEETVIINGTFPKEVKELGPLIEDALMTVTYDADKVIDPFEEVDFNISTEGTELVFANSMASMLMFNRDGKVPSESANDATFLVGKAFSEIEILERKQFCLDRIQEMPIPIEEMLSTEPIEIDGMSGFEITAMAETDEEGTQEKLYQVILFSDSPYYIIFGTSAGDHDKDLGMFRTMTRSFERK